jgi:excisionase family DNA binding protein
MDFKISFKKPSAMSMALNGTIRDGNQHSGETESYSFSAKSWKEAKRILKEIVLRHYRHQNRFEDANTKISGSSTKHLLTTEQLCNQLKISERTCRRQRSQGKIPTIKQGRNVRFDLDAVIKAQRSQTAVLSKHVTEYDIR